jgi:hypothetical protein
MKLQFVKARPVDLEWRDDRDYHLTIQLLVDNNGIPKPVGFSSGWRGMPTINEDVYPFILNPNGRVDFGAYETDDERFGECTIIEVEIRPGSKFEFVEQGERTHYQIYQVETLLQGGSE